jgi:hypothetical protein
MESLLLMSMGKAIIIGNSTFSFWAGQMADRAETIIAPLTWFKGMADPDDLIPLNWTRVPSKWEQTGRG